jgi:hypothetical protein
MPFTVSDFNDLVEILHAQPRWQAELRRLLLTDEVLELPEIVRSLVEAQKRTEAQIKELVEAQKRTEAQIKELVEAQKRTEEGLRDLTGVVRKLEERTSRLEGETLEIRRDVSKLRGQALEQRYRECASSYFSPLLRRIRVLGRQELADLLEEAEDQQRISEQERRELLAADIVIRGLKREDRQEAYLAVEVSGTVDREDVERAAGRAALLSRLTERPVLAVVAGEAMTDRAWDLACQRHVCRVVDGSVTTPEEDA